MKKKVDFSLSACCGVKMVKISGLTCCSKCRRQMQNSGPGHYAAASRRDQLDREFNREHRDPSTIGRLDHELK